MSRIANGDRGEVLAEIDSMPATQFGRVIQHIHTMAAGRQVAGPTDRELLDRFSLYADESAFAAMVSRHGPMVFRVCRRVLNHEQDSEDAFQAVFLVLARNAAGIRKREALAEWLHGVAFRTAMKAKRSAARRRNHEAAVPMLAPEPAKGPSWDEVQVVLDEEIQRLPQTFRAAFVICVLEGKTGRQASNELGVPAGTVSSRLTAARKRLQQRLARRGIQLGTFLATLSIAENSGTAMPIRLLGVKSCSALLASASGNLTGSIAPHIVALASGVGRGMILTKLKIATIILLAAGLFGLGALGVIGAGQSEIPNQTAAAPNLSRQTLPQENRVATAQNQTQESITCTGQVLDPDGKPFAGARLYVNFTDGDRKEKEFPVQTTSDANGRFSFTFPRPATTKFSGDRLWYQVLAVGQGFGPDWSSQVVQKPTADLTLRLVKDHLVQGRIVDLEGKPVKDASLRIEHIDMYANLEAFFQTVRDRDWFLGESKGWSGRFPGQPSTITTGADGNFALTGVGQDRVIQFHLEGSGIQFGELRAIARDMAAPVQPRPMQYGPNITKVYGAKFDHAVLPSRLIRGMVRDKKTGKPVPGVEVRADGSTYQTFTDTQGRYEMLGCPKNAQRYHVTFTPIGKQYFNMGVNVPDAGGLEPVQCDVDLTGGIVAKGRLTNRLTGKPIEGARVLYNPLYPNPSIRLLGVQAGNAIPLSWTDTTSDGSYSIVVLPGPGALGYTAPFTLNEFFMPALVTNQELKDFFKDNENHGNEAMLWTQSSPNAHSVMGQENCNHLELIHPAVEDETLTRDVALQPAQPLPGKVVDSAETALSGVIAYGLTPNIIAQRLENDTFTVQGLNPRRARNLVFIDKERKLGAFVSIKGEVKQPLTVQLQKTGSATGRLLDQDGQPVASAVVRLDAEKVYDDSVPARVQTDSAGRFKTVGLVPGQKYQARFGLPTLGQYLFKPFAVTPGETKELGDAELKPSK